MTIMSEPDIPAIELGEQEAAVGKPSRRGTIGVVVAGAAVVTLVNLTAAIYLYRSINDLRTVEARLELLGQFEQRIGARLDTVNNGFQSRFEKLDGQLQANFNEVNRSVARLELSRPAAADEGVSSAAEPTVVPASTMAEAPTVAENTAEPESIEMPRPPRKRAAPPPANPAYQRIEQADGKVYYRKVN
jgi:hypothetical protein